MIAVITGDVIHSRQVPVETWLPALKEGLQCYGKERKNWEIYRGDSFQLEIPVKDALFAAIALRLCLRIIPNLDLRIAIGIGDKNYAAKSIKESNGSAFENSGLALDQLKSHHQTLRIQTDDQDFNRFAHISLDLISHLISTWKPASCYILYHIIMNQRSTQNELSEKIHRKQSQISRVNKRSGFEELRKALDYLTEKLIAR